jgi:hypothetical protein
MSSGVMGSPLGGAETAADHLDFKSKHMAALDGDHIGHAGHYAEPFQNGRLDRPPGAAVGHMEGEHGRAPIAIRNAGTTSAAGNFRRPQQARDQNGTRQGLACVVCRKPASSHEGAHRDGSADAFIDGHFLRLDGGPCLLPPLDLVEELVDGAPRVALLAPLVPSPYDHNGGNHD